jgi:outer membrane murein-binding lipoprotein Lpp
MTMYNENKALMERVKLDHQCAVAAAKEKLTRTQTELNEKITQLEDKLARTTAELGAAHKEVKAQATEASR